MLTKRLLPRLWTALSAFTFVCFASYFIKLIISPEGTLPWIVTTGVMAATLLPFLLRHRLKRLLGRAYTVLMAVMCVGMAFFTVSFAALTAFIYLSPSAEAVPTGESAVCIVFGGKVYPDRVTSTLRSRLDTAADYLEADPTAVCITSGGRGPDEYVEESVAMKEYLVSRGIDESRILTEERASDTKENIRYSLELIESEELDGRRIVCISSDTHIPRIRLLCSLMDVEAEYVKAPTPNVKYVFTTLVREYLSYVKLALTGT